MPRPIGMPRPIRMAIRPALLLSTLLGLLVMGSLPASAGGPTSVLISSPSTESTASLYTTDGDYELLFEALGGPDPAADPSAAAALASRDPGPGGSQVNVTWLIHDVSVWRVDRIVTDDEGDVWIYTEGSVPEPYGSGQTGVWHRSPKPEQLRDLLERLGISWSGSTASAPVAGTPTAEVGSADRGGAAADNHLAGTPQDTTSPWAWVASGRAGRRPPGRCRGTATPSTAPTSGRAAPLTRPARA